MDDTTKESSGMDDDQMLLDQFSSEDCTPRDDDIPSSTIKFGDLFATRSDYSKGVFYRGHKKYLTNRNMTNTFVPVPIPNYNALEPPELFMTRAQTRKHKKISNLSLLKTLDFKVVNNDVDEKAKKAALIRKQEDKIKQKRNKPPTTIVLEKYSSYSKKDWKEVHQAGCKFYVNKGTGEVTSEAPWDSLPDDLNMDTPNVNLSSLNSSTEPTGMRNTMSAGGRSSMLVNKLRSNVLASNVKSVASVARASLAISRLGSEPVRYAGGMTLIDQLKKKREESMELEKEKEAKEKEQEEYMLLPDAEGTGSVVYDRTEVEEFFRLLDSASAAETKFKDKKRPQSTPYSPSRTWRDK